ncbi:MAG: hypothetical protein ACRBBO_09195 [Cognatishimia sp.]|nr:hypothetical protein [Cognatishimia sp. 1_MG-2023]MDO6727456.1 hypothetical protein [Cognatishimia sp. 1_MG-2023]
MPISMQKDPQQTSASTRPTPPVKQTASAPEPKKQVFTDWAMI